MEQRLFIVGALMGIYWLWFRQLKAKNKLLNPRRGAFMHGIFGGWLAYVGMMLLSISMESRVSASAPYKLTGEQIALWSAAVIGAFGWNFIRYLKFADTEKPEAQRDDLEWAETISSAMLLASVVMYIFVQAFRIPSGSMRLTLLEGDRLFVNKIVYGLRIPYLENRIMKFKPVKRGDVVVFRFPSEKPDDVQCGGLQYDKDFIKRVIGLPGDSVEVKDGVVFINGKMLSSEFYANYSDLNRINGVRDVSPSEYQKTWLDRDSSRVYGELVRDNFGPVTVPMGSYFMMGDNRDHSCDSRFWGPVPEKNVKGKAWFVYWPPGRLSSVK